eukprot:scaffold37372_cov23-Cyclotella_meneghiniana.AAC.2
MSMVNLRRQGRHPLVRPSRGCETCHPGPPYTMALTIQVPISRRLPLYPQNYSKLAAATGYHTVSNSFDIAAIL